MEIHASQPPKVTPPLNVEELVYQLESRVYSLEKEMQLTLNILCLVAIAGVYLGARWYMSNMAHIPGVGA